MEKRIPTIDEFINEQSKTTYKSLKEGRVKNAMYDMIENIVNSFNDAKSNKDKDKIATIIEDICGYDPRNEKTEDFETALWELEFPDLIEITENIKKQIRNYLNSKEKLLKARKFMGLKIIGDKIMGYEPYFDKDVTVASIDNQNKEIRPAHGYFIPHKYGVISKKYADSIGYNFNNN